MEFDINLDGSSLRIGLEDTYKFEIEHCTNPIYFIEQVGTEIFYTNKGGFGAGLTPGCEAIELPLKSSYDITKIGYFYK